MITTIFAVYALAFLAALLTAGSLSDYIGRRPLVLGALLGVALAMMVFHFADSAGTLVAARLVQGYATGIAASTAGAVLLDVSKARGSLINAIAPFLGTGSGALGAAMLVEYFAAPEQVVYLILLAAFVAQLAAVLFLLPETAVRRPGAWRSLRPHLSVPRQARRPLLSVVPILVACWALAGFYLSLMPSVVRLATGTLSPLIGGIVVSAVAFSAGVGVYLMRDWTTRTILVLGTSLLLAGVAITLGGIHLQTTALMFVGTVLSGAGFGAGFYGGMRAVVPLAAPTERAGLLSSVFVICYLAFSLPTIAVGFLVPVIGLLEATIVYAVSVMALAAISLSAALKSAKG
jgi:MFS family permease